MLHLARVDVHSTGGVHYEIRDDEGMIALADSVAANHGDDAVVASWELDDHDVRTLDMLRAIDMDHYRLALVEISSRPPGGG